MVTEADQARFARIVRETIVLAHDASGGIGTLGEKRMHAIIKDFLGDKCEQEIRVDRSAPAPADRLSPERSAKYVADVLRGDMIYEVQTSGFYPLRAKLAYYLSHTPYRVTVVHPIAAVKYLTWIDPATGELSVPHKSPKKGSTRDVAGELYWLIPYFTSGRVSLRLLFLDVREYRMRNGWGRDGKRGSARYERVPTALTDDVVYENPVDFKHGFLPDTLPDAFTAAVYAKATGIRGKATYGTLAFLTSLGLLTDGEKQGRSKIWQKTGI